MGSPAAHGAAFMQQQEPGVAPAAASSGSLAQAAGSEHSIAAGQLAPAAGAGSGAGLWAGAHAHVHAADAAAAGYSQHLQQPLSLAALGSVGELVLFVDTSVLHLTQLYSMCMLLAASGQQHAGMVAIEWVIRVRAYLSSSSSDVSAIVAHMVMRLCSTLIAIAAGPYAGSFNSVFLVVMLEQLLMALLGLRALCTDPQAVPAQSPGSIVQAWLLQLQAGADTGLGLVVLEAVSKLCGMWN